MDKGGVQGNFPQNKPNEANAGTEKRGDDVIMAPQLAALHVHLTRRYDRHIHGR